MASNKRWHGGRWPLGRLAGPEVGLAGPVDQRDVDLWHLGEGDDG